MHEIKLKEENGICEYSLKIDLKELLFLEEAKPCLLQVLNYFICLLKEEINFIEKGKVTNKVKEEK